MNTRAILSPNSEFERKQELNKLFNSNKTLSKKEIDVLNSCTTEDHESIGLIGCVLKDNSNVNKARLIIASNNQSNIELVSKADNLLSCSEKELDSLVTKLADIFILESENKTDYEDKVYSILFQIVK